MDALGAGGGELDVHGGEGVVVGEEGGWGAKECPVDVLEAGEEEDDEVLVGLVVGKDDLVVDDCDIAALEEGLDVAPLGMESALEAGELEGLFLVPGGGGGVVALEDFLGLGELLLHGLELLETVKSVVERHGRDDLNVWEFLEAGLELGDAALEVRAVLGRGHGCCGFGFWFGLFFLLVSLKILQLFYFLTVTSIFGCTKKKLFFSG